MSMINESKWARWIALYVNGDNVLGSGNATYIDNFEYFPKEIIDI